jgi:hypothetical protein
MEANTFTTGLQILNPNKQEFAMKALLTCAVLAAVALFAGSANADCYYGHGGYTYCAPSYFVQPHFVQPHLHWHDTSHWDYHPTQIIDHGCHYHVIPGHYDFHETGHYDLHW